jgi:hypothetical protein
MPRARLPEKTNGFGVKILKSPFALAKYPA